MKLVFDRVETRCRRGRVTVDVENTDGIAMSWAMVNDGEQTAIVDAVAVVWRVVDAREPVRMFRHGFQSWSPSGLGDFGVDEDPSRTPGAIPLVVDMHHADPAIAEPDELRSELVTVLDDGSGDPPLVVGFLGRRPSTTERSACAGAITGLELWAEAYFGGDRRSSEAPSAASIRSSRGRSTTTSAARSTVGGRDRHVERRACRARRTRSVGAPGTTTSSDVDRSAIIAANLALATVVAVRRLPDRRRVPTGRSGTGSTTNDKFDASLDELAAGIVGRRARARPLDRTVPRQPEVERRRRASGLVRARTRPTATARRHGQRPLGWTGPRSRHDATRGARASGTRGSSACCRRLPVSEARLHVRARPRRVGTRTRRRTPAQRVRAGFDAIRRGAGDDVFILGCGAPLGACIGAVDGMRIGPDVAPWWTPPSERWSPPGYGETSPATAFALAATKARQFMHRRSVAQRSRLRDAAHAARRRCRRSEVRRWAIAVGESGGMALVSDDLSLLGTDERSLLDEVIALGRANDAAYERQVMGSTSERKRVR